MALRLYGFRVLRVSSGLGFYGIRVLSFRGLGLYGFADLHLQGFRVFEF